MTYDSRAFVYCNLGEVINGTIAESSPSTGLITVKGSCVLKGIVQVSHGDKIEFAYYKNGALSRLGRSLYVIGSTRNAIERTTTVNYGCKLAYNEKNEPGPNTLDSADDTSKADIPEITRIALLKQLTAQFMVDDLLDLLGIAHAVCPLTNRFYRETEAVNGPWLQTVAQLLVSECYAGYMDEFDVFQYVNIADIGEDGFLLENSDIISITSAAKGEPLPEAVYSTAQHKVINLDITLREGGSDKSYGGGGNPADPEPPPGPELPGLDAQKEAIEQAQKEYEQGLIDQEELYNTVKALNDAEKAKDPDNPDKYGNDNADLAYFDSGYTIAKLKTSQTWKWTNEATGQEYIEEYSYVPRTDWTASYNKKGELQSRSEITNGFFGDTIKTSYNENKVSNGAEITEEVVYTYSPGARLVEACGFSEQTVPTLRSAILAVAAANPSYTWTEYEYNTTTSKGKSSIRESLTLAPFVSTTDGSAAIGAQIEYYQNIFGEQLPSSVVSDILFQAAQLRVSGGETSVTNSGKAATPKAPIRSDVLADAEAEKGKAEEERKKQYDAVQERLQQKQNQLKQANEDRLAALKAKQEEFKKIQDERIQDLGSKIEKDYLGNSLGSDRQGATYTYNVADKPELYFIEGGTQAKTFLELTPPYVPDDRVIATGAGYRVEPSDAPQKVTAYARTQFGLMQGLEYGYTVVHPVENYSRPCKPAYILIEGVMAKFMATESTIAFNSSGILLSNVMLLQGTVGSTTPAVIASGNIASNNTVDFIQSIYKTANLEFYNTQNFNVTNLTVQRGNTHLLFRYTVTVDGVVVLTSGATAVTAVSSISLGPYTPAAKVILTIDLDGLYDYTYWDAALCCDLLGITQVN
jgi:hypothetical protein